MAVTPPVLPLRIQTTSGKLLITDTSITLEKPTFPRVTTVTIPRANISSVANRPGISPLFGMGGNFHIEINTIDGRQLVIKGIPYKSRRDVLSILQPEAL
jgi:hypothetical protein